MPLASMKAASFKIYKFCYYLALLYKPKIVYMPYFGFGLYLLSEPYMSSDFRIVLKALFKT